MTGERSTWKSVADAVVLQDLKRQLLDAEIDKWAAVRDLLIYLSMVAAMVGLVIGTFPTVAVIMIPLPILVCLGWAWGSVMKLFRSIVTARYLKDAITVSEVMDS